MSNSPNRGDSSRSQLCVGTPTNAVTLWRSISSSAWSGSQRRCITSFSCAPKHESITGTHPVTWKSGTMRMKQGGLAAGASGSRGPLTIPCSAPLHAKAISDWQIDRCVETAPFGNPVVPEV